MATAAAAPLAPEGPPHRPPHRRVLPPHLAPNLGQARIHTFKISACRVFIFLWPLNDITRQDGVAHSSRGFQVRVAARRALPHFLHASRDEVRNIIFYLKGSLIINGTVEHARIVFPMQFRDEPGDLRAAEPRHPERDHAGPLPAQERRHAGTAQEELPEEDQHGRRYARG